MSGKCSNMDKDNSDRKILKLPSSEIININFINFTRQNDGSKTRKTT
jgi:hypothetical protein